jgi:hypothetical protein
MHPAARRSLSTRWLFGIAALLLLLYALNIAAGMLVVKTHATIWRLNDVGEFVLVLSCMAFFVAGLVADEERGETSPGAEGAGDATKGGS